jgi:FKBP-type peptidyl-prolyl cis-trans isomerase
VKASIVDKDTGLTLASDFYPKEEAAIKAVRPGWAEQNPDDWWMYLKVGDFWTLYIPYQSGYGSSTNDGNLQAYSALVYNVRLEKIVER